MILDLAQIDDEPLRFDHVVELEPERLDAVRLAGPVTVHLAGEVRRRGSAFAVAGSYQARAKLLCARCLEATPWVVEEGFAVEYRPAGELTATDGEVAVDESDLDVDYLGEDTLSITDMAVERVLLALPMRVVCDEDCAGLCPQCGANRNVAGACSCEPDPDPRWEALRGLGEGAG